MAAGQGPQGYFSTSVRVASADIGLGAIKPAGGGEAFSAETVYLEDVRADKYVFLEKHQNTTLEEAKEMLERSHREIMQLAERFSNEELFAKGVFDWVGNSALGSYFVSNTSSHYAWALKKLKAHRKNCKTGG